MEKIGDYLEIHGVEAMTAHAPTETRRDRYVIRSKVHTKTPVKVLYMASLELDGVELVESFRLAVEPGENMVDLPEMFVVNPIFSAAPGQGVYHVTLKLYAQGFKEYPFSADVTFSSQEEG